MKNKEKMFTFTKKVSAQNFQDKKLFLSYKDSFSAYIQKYNCV